MCFFSELLVVSTISSFQHTRIRAWRAETRFHPYPHHYVYGDAAKTGP